MGSWNFWELVSYNLCRNVEHLGHQTLEEYLKYVGTWCAWGFGYGSSCLDLVLNGIISPTPPTTTPLRNFLARISTYGLL